MAKPELGTKRICPETGRKFYDLKKDPIVSPYTGTSYPLSFFEAPARVKRGAAAVPDEEEVEVEVIEAADDAPETVSLADVEEDEEVAAKEDVVDIEDEEEVEVDDADDTFLEADEDEDDMTDIIGSREDDDD